MKPLHFFIAILLAGSFTGYAQDDRMVSNTQENIITDQSLLRAIAPYHDDVRNDILIATQYPDILEKAAQIQDRSRNSFQQIIQDYAQKKQTWFYELSRYPDLMHKLATMPRKASRDVVEGMLPNPSPELKEAAWKLYANHHSDLVAVDNLNSEASESFQNMIALLNPDARDAFNTLEGMPELLSLLNDHADLTARLGERFKSDPDKVRQDLADVHDQLETDNKQELAAYQDELSQNPQALQELGKASQEYASTGGYSYPAPTGDKVVNYGSPYSYWFGYPYWYGSSMWYPGMYGYGSGFYLGAGGYPIVYALPSLGFSRWFFGGAYRYYPHLYRQYDHYYHSNVVRGGRYISPSRNAFIGTAGRHFSPSMSARTNGFYNANRGYSQYRMAPSQGSRMAPRASYSPRVASPSFGGRSYGGGFSRGGGGFGGGHGRR